MKVPGLVAAALAGMLTLATPAAACSMTLPPSLDEVLDDRAHEWSPGQLVGVVERETIATAPAIPPLLTERHRTRITRIWGAFPEHRSTLDTFPRSLGDSFWFPQWSSMFCGFPHNAPLGTQTYLAVVRAGDEWKLSAVSLNEWGDEWGGLYAEQHLTLEHMFGPARPVPTPFLTGLRSAVALWWPHAVGVLLVVWLMLVMVRRVRRRRGSSRASRDARQITPV